MIVFIVACVKLHLDINLNNLESAANKRRAMILSFEVEDDPIPSCCDTDDNMELQHIESMVESDYFTPVNTGCIII